MVPGCGLDFGITSWHLRLLCENPWNGGAGYTPQQVADMTPDQIYFRLCDISMLKRTPDGRRIKRIPSYSVAGTMRGRTVDGKIIELPIRKDGKTQLQLIEERLRAKAKQSTGKRRRKRRGT